MKEKVRGLAYVLGNDIDTDQIIPAEHLMFSLSDPEEKKNYGKTYMGIERSTFLIGPDKKVIRIWRKVRVKGHAEDVLNVIKSDA